MNGCVMGVKPHGHAQEAVTARRVAELLSEHGPLSVRQAAALMGRSYNVTRLAMQRLLDEGRVRCAGQFIRWQGRGGRARLWELRVGACG